MTRKKPSNTTRPDAPFARIVAGAKSEDEQLRALEAAAQLEIALPAEALVVGEAVVVAAIVYSGQPRAGLTIRCERGGRRFSIGLADVAFPRGSPGARFVSLYRAWLGLTPLALREQGEWDPDDEYWVEEGDPVPAWAKPIIARGKRPMFEMKQVVPGANPGDFDSDPILEAAELRSAGDRRGAYELLMNLLAKDLRCLDAHAHLGNLEFDRRPKQAFRHYEVGMMIGAFSLGKDFAGVLPWGLIDNRPFLRCVHGAGLCAWRLGDVRTAKAIFTKMQWLNPSDNQGARFNLVAVEAGKTWDEMEGEAP